MTEPKHQPDITLAVDVRTGYEGRCLGCGGAFRPARATHLCCSPRCRRRWASRRRRSPAEPEVIEFPPLDLIYKRDRGRCGICGKPVRLDLPHRHPRSATVDHVVAVVHGGGDELVNLQLAHWACNRKKGRR
jgi:5-methylcytosine-specific restriction endonuclease McrA